MLFVFIPVQGKTLHIMKQLHRLFLPTVSNIGSTGIGLTGINKTTEQCQHIVPGIVQTIGKQCGKSMPGNNTRENNIEKQPQNNDDNFVVTHLVKFNWLYDNMHLGFSITRTYTHTGFYGKVLCTIPY